MVVHTCNPQTQEAEAGEFKNSLGYMAKSNLKREEGYLLAFNVVIFFFFLDTLSTSQPLYAPHTLREPYVSFPVVTL